MNNDKILVEKLILSDVSAFKMIYDKYWSKLFYSASIRLDSLEEIEDLIHDLFLDLWNNREMLFIKTTLNTYLKTALKYKIYRLYDYKSVRKNTKMHFYTMII